MYFYAVEPLAGPEGRSFTRGAYPLSQVLDRLRRLDPAAEEYRIREDLFGGETLCLLHEDGPEPLLGVYYRDNLTRALTEYKGEVQELVLREGEAIVDAAYAAFFPGDVVGLVRTSSKSPGFARLGQWLSINGGFRCGLFALPDPDTLMQLDRQPDRLRRLNLRIRRNRIAAVDAHSQKVARALRAAADVASATTEVGIDLGVSNARERTDWSRHIRQEIEELLGILPDFEQASVQVSGRKKPVNLKRANVTADVPVILHNTRKVGLPEAAEVLFEGYEQERASIEAALNAWRADDKLR